MGMRIKEYPDKRVCTIDFLPLLEEAVKEVYNLCRKYSIPMNTSGKGSTDITRFFYHYCLEKFCNGYTKCDSKYPKVLVIYNVADRGLIRNFINKGLDKVLKVLPLPWCKVRTFDSPDTAMAALSSLNNKKLLGSKLQKFSKNNELHNFLKMAGKSKYFPVGTVDLSLAQE